MEYSDKLSFFQRSVIGYNFKNESILQAALTHSSLNSQIEYVKQVETHERLRFLGSSMIRMLVSDLIFKKYPDESEGFLSALANRMHSRSTIAEVAYSMQLSDFIFMDPNYKTACNTTCLSNGLSAILAAMYLDGGLDISRDFITKHWNAQVGTAKTFSADTNKVVHLDPKAKLLSWASRNNPLIPNFRVEETSGPLNSPVFVVTATLSNYGSAIGRGQTKRSAEKDAASKLLKQLEENKWLTQMNV